MMRAMHTLRLRIARAIAPGSHEVVIAGGPATDRPLSRETLAIIRLGELWLRHAGTESFSEALRYPGHSIYCARAQVPETFWTARHAQDRWRAFRRLPPVRPRPRTYARFIEFFAAHWPADLAWPADIPRPAATISANTGKEEA